MTYRWAMVPSAAKWILMRTRGPAYARSPSGDRTRPHAGSLSTSVGQDVSISRYCTAIANATASTTVPNAKWKESPSVPTSCPPWRPKASRSTCSVFQGAAFLSFEMCKFPLFYEQMNQLRIASHLLWTFKACQVSQS